MRHAFLFVSSLGPGGAERAISELANWLAGDGWEVTLATLTDGSADDDYYLADGVRRVHIGNEPQTGGLWHKVLSNAKRVQALRKIFVKYSPTVVVSFIDSNNVLAILAAFGLRLPVVVSERTDPAQHLSNIPVIWRLGRRLLYRRASAVVAQTQIAANWLAEECRCSVEIIPNALRMLPKPLKDREPWVVSAGRIEHVKGFDIILDAFARVVDELPSWRLVIAGEGRLLDSLQLKAHELGIADRVDWLGYRKDIELVLGRASIVALASRYEGFPNILLEALGMGAAVVVSDCPSGPSEMVDSGKNGLLVSVDDVKAFADSIRRLAADPKLRKQLGKRALRVRSIYSQPTIMKRWSDLLDVAMEHNR